MSLVPQELSVWGWDVGVAKDCGTTELVGVAEGAELWEEANPTTIPARKIRIERAAITFARTAHTFGPL